MTPSIAGVTLACQHLDAMVAFYSAVLHTEFRLVNSAPRIYAASVSGFALQLVDFAEVGGEGTGLNRHQLRIALPGPPVAEARLATLGGKFNGPSLSSAGRTLQGAVDPDGNLIEFLSLPPP